MKGVIVYESHYGNTKIVAEAIAEQLKAEGHEVEMRNVREHGPASPQGDILFLGSPIRFGSVSGKIKDYVKKLDTDVWKQNPIVVFTTILALPKNATDKQGQSQDKYDIGAGRKLRDMVKSKGLNAAENPLWITVKGLRGPLVETGIEETRQFTRNIISSLTKDQSLKLV